MKIILTGATGFVGSAVLTRLLQQPSVTSIVVLSRRDLQHTNAKDPKIQTIIVQDFKNYSPEVREHIADARACIWCLGTPKDGAEVHYDYPRAAISAIEDVTLGNLADGGKFRFVYTSGGAVVRDQKQSVWLMGDVRKMRGTCEAMAIEAETRHPGQWQTFVVRPMYITNGDPLMARVAGGFTISKEALAATMVDVAINGGEMQTMENSWIKARGKTLLAGK